MKEHHIPKKRIVLPSVRKARFDKFKTQWDALEEEYKEIIAGALYVLNHKPVGRPEAVQNVKFAFDNYRKQLLSDLAKYMERK